MRRLLVAVILVFVALVFIGKLVPEDRSGNPSVYQRIERTTDCAALQDEFDVADRNGNVSYMEAADRRMRELGCYG